MNQETMTLRDLRQLLARLSKEFDGDYQIWLSSDEEGNEFLPMLRNTEFSLAVDKETKKIIFYPSHK